MSLSIASGVDEGRLLIHGSNTRRTVLEVSREVAEHNQNSCNTITALVQMQYFVSYSR